MVKEGRAWGVASEDMDSLTFGALYLLRGFNNKKEPITEISYKEVLEHLEMSHAEFVDLCILCGCDYTNTIEGVGYVTALKLIKSFKDIETSLDYI